MMIGALAFITVVIVLLAAFPETRVAIIVGGVWLVLLGAVHTLTIGWRARLLRR